MRCVTPREAARILVELHEGDFGSHSSGRSLVCRARRADYYWPTMAADANKQAKHCDRCQRHAPVSKLPPENLKSISSPCPFRKWGMNIVGKFPMAPGQKVFLLVVTDYFSKWIEAEALSRITYFQIQNFLWTNVITRFGLPVHKPQLQGVLHGLGHKTHLRHTPTPPVQRTSRIHEQNHGQHAKKAIGGFSWEVGRRITRSPLGLPDYSQGGDTENSLLASLWL